MDAQDRGGEMAPARRSAWQEARGVAHCWVAATLQQVARHLPAPRPAACPGCSCLVLAAHAA